MRYVAEAPLEAVSASYRRAAINQDLEMIIHEAVTSVGALRAEVAVLSAASRRHFDEEVKLAKEIQAIAVNRPDDCGLPYIRTVLGRTMRVMRVHRALDPSYTSLPPSYWKTKCGWPFGLSTFTRHASRPEGVLCDRCFVDAAVQDSDSE